MSHASHHLTAIDTLGTDIRAEIDAVAAGLPATVSCVATGSLIEGFGNPNSDVDLFVIHEEGVPQQSIAIGMRAARYVDCEYMSRASLDSLAARMADGSWASLVPQARPDFDRYYRLCIGVPIRTTAATSDTLGRFDLDVARGNYAWWALARAFEHVARCAAALALGDRPRAGVILREGALYQASSTLAEEGEGYPGLKWLGEKAARRYGRGSAAFQQIVDDCYRPEGSLEDRLDRLRLRVDAPAALRAALKDRSCALDPETTVGLGHDSHVLVRRRKIAEAGPIAAGVCRQLATGESWAQAVDALAVELSLTKDEAAVAAWFYTADLRAEGFLTDDHRKAA
ncbi:nucleotidyltransferase domain-containing protein [Catenulispora pinisilvae]|uniref:nucleotidyltransferase domain-containing protein n=1 Tax=Catenulispora pinisilvae TaxID=2705253 RepID=UPI00189117A6|nr:nucleotidyltransferase domain-containing protein [Catenulispora pinisilvae]